jgi:hypothetical protein
MLNRVTAHRPIVTSAPATMCAYAEGRDGGFVLRVTLDRSRSG